MPSSDWSFAPTPSTARFAMDGWYVWCPSITQGADGCWHLFFSRWPKDRGFKAWVTDSEIAWAKSTSLFGPYTFQKTILPAREKKYWDGCVTHNSKILHHHHQFHLYYMGNTGDGQWWNHRNHQRIGVAVADKPAGPWRRFDHPLIDVNPASWNALLTSNPSVCYVGTAGKKTFLMIYKTVSPGPMPFGGTVFHAATWANNPLGPFAREPDPIFTQKNIQFAAEDPCVWHEPNRKNPYRAVVKDMAGHFTYAGMSLASFESPDGIHWQPAQQPLVSRLEIQWETHREQVQYLERPEIILQNERPAALACAVKPLDERTESFIVIMPVSHHS